MEPSLASDRGPATVRRCKRSSERLDSLGRREGRSERWSQRWAGLRGTLRRALLVTLGLQFALAVILTLVDSYRRRGKKPKPFPVHRW